MPPQAGTSNAVDYEALADQVRSSAPAGIDYEALADQARQQSSGGAWNAIKQDVVGAAKGIGTLALGPGAALYQGGKKAYEEINSLKGTGKTIEQNEDDARKAQGRSLGYRMIAPMGEALGINVQGMEDAANKGDTGGVLGHAVVPAALAVAPLVGEAARPAVGSAVELAKRTPEALSEAKETALASPVRNNPVSNAILGPNPKAIPPEEAFIKATKPRNSIQNMGEHVQRALPDAVRAADNLGIDKSNMTLQDAENSVYQAKKDVWDEFEANHLGPNQHVLQDMNPVAQKVADSINNWSAIRQRQFSGVVNDVHDVVNSYAENPMHLGDVEDRIQELNNELRSQQSQFKVNESDLRRDPKYAYKFAELDGLRQVESDAFDQVGTAEQAKDLKQRYGSLKVMEDVINRRINVAERQNPARLFETAGRMSGVADIGYGIFKGDVPRIGAGLLKIRAGKNAQLLNDPDFLVSHAFSQTTPRAAMQFNPQGPAAPSGLLGEGAKITPPPADTSGSIPYNPPPFEATTRAQRKGLMLPERTAIEQPAISSDEALQILRARSQVVRDPRTGRMRKQFVTSGVQP